MPARFMLPASFKLRVMAWAGVWLKARLIMSFDMTLIWRKALAVASGLNENMLVLMARKDSLAASIFSLDIRANSWLSLSDGGMSAMAIWVVREVMTWAEAIIISLLLVARSSQIEKGLADMKVRLRVML